jgi:hypothetical protein
MFGCRHSPQIGDFLPVIEFSPILGVGEKFFAPELCSVKLNGELKK